MNEIRQLDPTEARSLVDEGAFLLDVREGDEWAAGRAPESTHVPLGALRDSVSSLPVDRLIVAVCRSGGRSLQAVRQLTAQGYEAANLEGGMRAWAAAGLPMVADADEPKVI
ncbi:MAG: rhodanese-like domain-containing protein [Acidimicrobiia bacterium]|nr:rhodanese-like domain-containing protein [Acidimicrobiia bacterium]